MSDELNTTDPSEGDVYKAILVAGEVRDLYEVGDPMPWEPVLRLLMEERARKMTTDTNQTTDGWCSKCGAGNDAAGYAHLPMCPTQTTNLHLVSLEGGGFSFIPPAGLRQVLCRNCDKVYGWMRECSGFRCDRCEMWNERPLG